jgi:lipid II:glycine glycyltransferase (peptidoglycan interpeptide bridge formation enzyme)
MDSYNITYEVSKKPSDKLLRKIEVFVNEHPHGNFFQSIKAFNLFSSIPNHSPIFLIAYFKTQIIGCLLVLKLKEPSKIKGYFSRRCIIQGGPLVQNDSESIYASLLNLLNTTIKSDAIYVEFRNHWQLESKHPIFKKYGYKFKDHLNYIISIESKNAVWLNLSKSKKRQINKSLRSGAKIVEVENMNQLNDFYSIIHHVYSRKIKKPTPAYRIFHEFYKNDSYGKVFVIIYQNEVIGGILCPIYQDKIYELYIGGKDDKLNGVYPSVLATWAAIEYALKTKMRYFDFLGAGQPDKDYGVREFKSKFGGELVNYGRYQRINNAILYQIGRLGITLLGLIK